MKKLLSVLLICCLLMGLVACSSAAGETATTAAKDERLRVGYAREDITPGTPVALLTFSRTVLPAESIILPKSMDLMITVLSSL